MVAEYYEHTIMIIMHYKVLCEVLKLIIIILCVMEYNVEVMPFNSSIVIICCSIIRVIILSTSSFGMFN